MKFALVAALVLAAGCTRANRATPGDAARPATEAPAATDAAVVPFVPYPDAEAPRAAAKTPKALAEYCGPRPCSTYDASVAEVKKLGSPGGGPGCLDGEAGTCGALRYVFYNDGFSSFERWFDASGAMVGVRTHADYDPDGAVFGVAPAKDSCTKTKTLALCARR